MSPAPTPSTRPARVRRVLIALVAVSVIAGCSRVRRARECAAVARQVNGELTAIEARLAAAPADSAALEFAAERYAAAAAAVSSLPPTETKLQRAREEYRWHLVRAAASTRKHAAAEGEEARIRSERDLAQEARLGSVAADRIDAACRAP